MLDTLDPDNLYLAQHTIQNCHNHLDPGIVGQKCQTINKISSMCRSISSVCWKKKSKSHTQIQKKTQKKIQKTTTQPHKNTKYKKYNKKQPHKNSKKKSSNDKEQQRWCSG